MKNTKLFMFAACTLFLAACGKQTVKIMTPPDASNRIPVSYTHLCLLGAHLLSAGEIWISPQGNDLNDGTRPSPKATLTSACLLYTSRCV